MRFFDQNIDATTIGGVIGPGASASGSAFAVFSRETQARPTESTRVPQAIMGWARITSRPLCSSKLSGLRRPLPVGYGWSAF